MLIMKKFLVALSAGIILIQLSCSKNEEPGSRVLVTFKGGNITSDEVDKRAGEYMRLLKKREYEIKYRIAMQILYEKIQKLEKGIPDKSAIKKEKNQEDGKVTDKKDTTSSTQEKNSGDETAANKNIKKDSSQYDMHDEKIQMIFKKYDVINNIKKP